MEGGPIYNISLSSLFASRLNKTIETYVIDRIPQGPMGLLVELQDNSITACDPCGGGMNSRGHNTPNRFCIKLPDSVKQAYPSARHKTDYVDTYTLPGFISWMAENGYFTLDMKHVVGIEAGFWVQFSESVEPEFRSARQARPVAAAPRARPPPAPAAGRAVRRIARV